MKALPSCVSVFILISALALGVVTSELVECEGLVGRNNDLCIRNAAADIPLNFTDTMLTTCQEAQDVYLRAECIAIVAYRLFPVNVSHSLDACNLISEDEPRSACLGLIAARQADKAPAEVARESVRLPPRSARIWVSALVRDYGLRHTGAEVLGLCASFSEKLQRTCIEHAIDGLNTTHSPLCTTIPFPDLNRRCTTRTSGELLTEPQADGTLVALVVLLLVSVGTVAIMHIDVVYHNEE